MRKRFLDELKNIEEYISNHVDDLYDVGLMGYTLTPLILNYLQEKKVKVEDKIIHIKKRFDLEEHDISTYKSKMFSNFENFKEIPVVGQGHFNETYIFNTYIMKDSTTYQCVWDFFVQDMNYNCFQIAYSAPAKKLYYTEEFLGFLDNLIVERVKDEFLLKDILYLNFLNDNYDNIKYNPSLDIKTFATALLSENSITALNNGYSFDDKNPYSEIQLNHNELKLLMDNKERFFPYLSVASNKSLYVNLGNNETSPYMELLREESLPNHLSDARDIPFIEFMHKGTKRWQERLCSVLRSAILHPKFYHGAFSNRPLIEESISKDFNEKELISLHDFMVNHEGLRRSASSMLKNCTWQIPYIAAFMKVIKKEDCNRVIGYVENYVFETMDVPHSKKDAIKLAKDVIKKYWDERKENEVKLVEAIDLKDFKDREGITELTTNIELEIEGENMNHCVGGYAESINENHRIFNINIDDSLSTLEIKNTHGMWKSVQHRSRFNENPPQTHSDKALNLLIHLNREFDKKESDRPSRTIERIDKHDLFRIIDDRGGERFTRNIQDYENEYRNMLRKIIMDD